MTPDVLDRSAGAGASLQCCGPRPGVGKGKWQLMISDSSWHTGAAWPKPSSPGRTGGISKMTQGVSGKSLAGLKLATGPCRGGMPVPGEGGAEPQRARGDEGCAEHHSVPSQAGARTGAVCRAAACAPKSCEIPEKTRSPWFWWKCRILLCVSCVFLGVQAASVRPAGSPLALRGPLICCV